VDLLSVQINLLLLISSINNLDRSLFRRLNRATKWLLTSSRRLLRSESQLSIENESLLYKTILKLIWAYGVQLWGTISDLNMEILQSFENKYLEIIVNA